MKKSILVVRFSSLGDIVLTSPAVLNLRLHYPDSEIVYLTQQRFEPIVRAMAPVDEVVCIPDHAPLSAYLGTLRGLRHRRFEAVVDLHGNFRSGLARRTLKAERKVVRPKLNVQRRIMVRRRGKLIPEHPTHSVDLNNATVTALGHLPHADRPLLHPANSKSTDKRSRRVIIAPGAAHPPKAWPIEKFAEAAEIVREQTECDIVWLYETSSENGSEIDRFVAGREEKKILDESLEAVTAHLADAQLVIANDSGIGHVASGVGTPVVALFGPTHQALGFAPRGLWDRVIEVDEACRPCSLHGQKLCFREEQYCFTRITAETVARTAVELIEQRQAAGPAMFLDRDGTLIKEKEFLSDPDGVEFETQAFDSLRAAQERGYKLVILSNQSGVARGLMRVDDVLAVNARVLELLSAERIDIDAFYFCPYYRDGTVAEYALVSRQRKPSPGMAETAARELNIDLRRSIVFGDRKSDIDLARVLGARACLVRTGYGKGAESELSPKDLPNVLITDNLYSGIRSFLDEADS
jgi:histidinol-phosphate phosphatase family protein